MGHRRWADDEWDAEDDYPAWDDDFDADQDDDDDDVTVPCPHCRRLIHEDAERCPYCERYLSEEEPGFSPKPWWVLLGAFLSLYVVYRWIVGW